MNHRQVGPYVLFGELGRGGMGVVYRARHQGAGRDVALKVLPRQRLSAEAAERFRREGEATAAIRHPNVVRIHDAGQWGEVLYLAYELVEGGRDLSDRVGRVSPEEAAALVAQVADGVGAAHALGIVHRDLKPANVLLDREGRPKVADFGVAREEGSQSLTKTGGLVGTPYYMAPECAMGSRGTKASDVWSMGVLLYELVGGSRPFVADSLPGLITRVLESEPAPLRVEGRAGRRVWEVCKKALAKDPSRRYPDGKALGEALRGEGAGERERRRWPWGVAAAGVLGAVVGVGATWEGDDGAGVLEEPAGVSEVEELVEEDALSGEAYRRGLEAFGRGERLRAARLFAEGVEEAPEAEEREEAVRVVRAALEEAQRWDDAYRSDAFELLERELDVAWALYGLGAWEGLSEERSALWERMVFVLPYGGGDPRRLLVTSRMPVLAPTPSLGASMLNDLVSVRNETVEEVSEDDLVARGWSEDELDLIQPERVLHALSVLEGVQDHRPWVRLVERSKVSCYQELARRSGEVVWLETLQELIRQVEARCDPEDMEERDHLGHLHWEAAGTAGLLGRGEDHTDHLRAYGRWMVSLQPIQTHGVLLHMLQQGVGSGEQAPLEFGCELGWRYLEWVRVRGLDTHDGFIVLTLAELELLCGRLERALEALGALIQLGHRDPRLALRRASLEILTPTPDLARIEADLRTGLDLMDRALPTDRFRSNTPTESWERLRATVLSLLDGDMTRPRLAEGLPRLFAAPDRD